MRRNTSNGLIQGALIDSENTFSQRVFLEFVFQYCKSAGIEIVSKAEAFDICFNHKVTGKNLIYNSELVNTAKKFFEDAEKLPSNPDGYEGDCYVEKDFDDKNILVTTGITNYVHYGIPYECMEYGINARGSGQIRLYCIKNKYSFSNSEYEQEKIAELVITTTKWKRYSIQFEIKDNPLTNENFDCEGYGDKIIGIRIEYSPNLQVRDLLLQVN